ncbi:MAG: tetratricopeptide repeat protein [Pseudomonadota bacterium]
MSDRIFLPARRGDTVIIFEHREVPDNRRWEFVAAAIQEAPDAPLIRTTAVGLNPDELEICSQIAAGFPAFEDALSGLPGLGITDLDLVDASLELPKALALVEGSILLTLTLYLQLIRNSLVTTASIRKYRSRPPAERIEAGLSGSVYQTLLKSHDLETGAELLEEDLAAMPDIPRRTRDWGFFYHMAGFIRLRRGELEEALELFRTSIRHAPDEALHRRMANIYADLERFPEAIDAFLKAEAITPLPPHGTIRLAYWMQQEGRINEAREFARLAQERGAHDAAGLIKSLG